MKNTDSTAVRVYDRNLSSFPVTVDFYGPYALVVDYADGTGSSEGWGKLKSGAGWIALDCCSKTSTASKAPAKKSVDEIAREIIKGTCSDSRWSTWGNGQTRKDRLAAAGYDYNAVQKRVNELL